MNVHVYTYLSGYGYATGSGYMYMARLLTTFQRSQRQILRDSILKTYQAPAGPMLTIESLRFCYKIEL